MSNSVRKFRSTALRKMVKSNESLLKIIQPHNNMMCNINLIKPTKNLNSQHLNNSRKSTNFKQTKVNVSNTDTTLTNSKCSTSNSLTSFESNKVHVTPSTQIPDDKSFSQKRSQYHESLERIRTLSQDSSSGSNKNTLTYLQKYDDTFEPVYQRNYFIKSIEMVNEPRNSRLNSTKLEFEKQLKQISQNRKINSLSNMRSRSVCDIIRETKQRIQFEKSNNSQIDNDLKQKAASSSLNVTCNYPSCQKVILSPLQFCYQHYFIRKLSQDTSTTSKDSQRRDSFETAENYLNKKSKKNKSTTPKSTKKRKADLNHKNPSTSDNKIASSHSDESKFNNQSETNEFPLMNNGVVQNKSQKNLESAYFMETKGNQMLSPLRMNCYDLLSTGNNFENGCDLTAAAVEESIIGLDETLKKVAEEDAKSLERLCQSHELFEKIFAEDHMETISSEYNSNAFTNSNYFSPSLFHNTFNLDKNFLHCDMNSSMATISDNF